MFVSPLQAMRGTVPEHAYIPILAQQHQKFSSVENGKDIRTEHANMA
jgi:hypothetical protein